MASTENKPPTFEDILRESEFFRLVNDLNFKRAQPKSPNELFDLKEQNNRFVQAHTELESIKEKIEEHYNYEHTTAERETAVFEDVEQLAQSLVPIEDIISKLVRETEECLAEKLESIGTMGQEEQGKELRSMREDMATWAHNSSLQRPIFETVYAARLLVRRLELVRAGEAQPEESAAETLPNEVEEC
ncbi:hypothetical protein BDV96DRAFT_654541 [Lophiotrema nucula]|uniref:Uncharacterized protein n=1 Tax=Lophiotrema nucula TaxID=690887 RepID=A0A6A5YHT8_9PLEO|nr:hypothetical protein BDV96DRAFT_654541 [Lophiotrema nucula]